MEKNQKTKSAESVSATAVDATTVASVGAKPNPTWRTVSIILGTLTALCCLCFMCFFYISGGVIGILTSDYSTFKTEFKDLCNIPSSRLQVLYNTKFTEEFKDEVTFSEFENFYESNKNFFDTCDESLNTSIFDGFSVKVSKTTNGTKVLDTTITTDNGTLEVQAVEVLNSWKINYLNIKE